MTFESKINERDLYKFQLYQAYHGTQGWSAIVLAVVAAVMCYRTYGDVPSSYTALYMVFSLIFLVYIPASLKMQSAKQYSAQGALRQTITYDLSEEGIRLRIEEQEDILPWNGVYVIKSNKNYLYIFSSRVYAYIIPRRLINDRYKEIVGYMQQNLQEDRIKVKK